MVDSIGGVAGHGAQVPGLDRVSLATPAASGTRVGGADFDDAVARAITSVSERLRQAETVSVAAMKGEVSLQKVVEEVMAAEQSLQTAIAVRDKVVAAYLEISRMQI
jgi:flagellar hook-basal body complex protein FliE